MTTWLNRSATRDMEIARGRLIRGEALKTLVEGSSYKVPDEVLEKRFGRVDLANGLRARALPLLLLGRVRGSTSPPTEICGARFDERKGSPPIVSAVPTSSDPGIVAKSRTMIETSLGTLGTETAGDPVSKGLASCCSALDEVVWDEVEVVDRIEAED